MRKHLVVILGAAASSSAVAHSTDAQLSRPSPDEAKSIVTLMCESQSCDGATSSTPGCHSYATPLRTCYNAKDLFPGDESWSEFDIYDDMIMLNIKRTFYTSADGSCTGRGEDEGGEAEGNDPVDGDDSFVLPLDECVGPFGPPRPWGKFSLSTADVVDGIRRDSEVLSVE